MITGWVVSRPNVCTVSIGGELWLCTIQISKGEEQITNIFLILERRFSLQLRQFSALLFFLVPFQHLCEMRVGGF